MANWYYYDNDTAEKKGPITGRQLKALAASGTILPDTVIETEDGKQGSAGKVSGLFPPQTPPPENNSGMRFEPARPVVVPPTQDFWAAARKKLALDEEDKTTGKQLNRYTYIFLAVFCGVFGLHDFYAKRTGPGLVHIGMCAPILLLIVGFCIACLFPELLLDMVDMENLQAGKPPVSGKMLLLLRISLPLFILSNLWSLLEIPFVENDGTGLPMKE